MGRARAKGSVKDVFFGGIALAVGRGGRVGHEMAFRVTRCAFGGITMVAAQPASHTGISLISEAYGAGTDIPVFTEASSSITGITDPLGLTLQAP